MSVTINAHQLGLLIDKTTGHIGSESIEQLHGIRLDVDATHLYAVATDRYTLAAARYQLQHGDKGQEPLAVTLPADHIESVREWLRTTKGAEWVTISAAKNRLIFEGTQADLSIVINPSLDFPNWRGLFRSIAAQVVDGEPFPALQSRYLDRWAATGHILRVRATADMKAVLLFGEDFIGAMMPAKYAGVGPVTDETFDSARSLWKDILADGDTADMATDMPEPEPGPRYEAATDVRETGEGLLQGVLQSTSAAFDTSHYDEDREAWHAHLRSGVANWMAYRYLDALYQVDPRAAQAVVTDTAEQLDSGEIGEWAWDAAEEAGHNPQKWNDDYDNALRERAADKAPLWAARLANGLNAARQAGIGFRVEDNPHVVFDEKREEWVAVKPQPAEATA